MGRITTGVGLVSGINSGQIIDQLISLEELPKKNIQTRIDAANVQKDAFADLAAKLGTLKGAGTDLRKPSTFQNANAVSTDDGVITATAGRAAAAGSYQFRVARLVTTQQTVGRGFADVDKTPVGAGKLTVELGGGELSTQNPLSDLNAGAGVRRGQIRVTDKAGGSAIIDTSDAVTLDDVLRKFNTNLDVNVHAETDGGKLVLTDRSGGSTKLTVADVGDNGAATDLGIVGSESSGTISGSTIYRIDRATGLEQLNDGRGVRLGGGASDFSVKTADGSTFTVSLAGSKTVGDVLDKFNAASGGKVRATLSANGDGFRLADSTPAPPPPTDIFGQPTGPAPARQLTVTAANGSNAAADLGLAGTTTGSATADGQAVLAGLGTTLVSSLFGATGGGLGTISVQSRSSNTAKNIDLAGSKDVATVLKRINDAGAGVRAELNASGNGIQIVDASGGTGDLVIGDVGGGQTAAAAGLAGTYGPDVTAAKGANLQRAWVNRNTLVKDYNGGRGVSAGTIRLTDSQGKTSLVKLTGEEARLGDVIDKINASGIGVSAGVNANGDGLLLTDTAGGQLKLTAEDSDGSAAKDLRLLGTADAGKSIDGSFEITLDVSATDTLKTVQDRLTALNFGVFANVVNDGTGDAPNRLSLTARDAGRAGRVVFDAGLTNLDTHTLVASQDAAVFIGDAQATGAQPLLVTSHTNQVEGAIQNVSLQLNGVSDKPVTVNVARSIDNVTTEIGGFLDNFNGLVDKIAELTKFDPDTGERGPLLGDPTVQRVQSSIYELLRGVNPAGGKYRTLGDVGLKLGDGAKLTFDQDKFKAAYADDPEGVSALFTNAQTGFGYSIEKQITRLTDPVDGVLTRQTNTINSQNDQFTKSIASLDVRITAKRDRLTQQFAQMESVLSGLQGQQTALGQIQSVKA